MENFNLTNKAVKMFCPDNVVQMDDAGLPSILVYIPAFKNSDVLNGGDDSTHPAFIVNGSEIPGFYYSKYQNVVHNGKAYSLPGEDPMASITIDQSRQCCEAKGHGWHLSTAVEWAAIALWCKKNGFSPYGNNDYGKDYMEATRKAIPTLCDSDGKINRVATGTGPLTWSHNGTMSGIWDLNGNVWEWQGGIRLVWGELQILANNDAADPNNPQNATSTRWKAISASDGSLVEPESKTTDTACKTSGNTVKLDYSGSPGWYFSTGISNASAETRSTQLTLIDCTADIGDKAKVLLRALALLADADAEGVDYKQDQVWLKNGISECVVYRGGRWLEGFGVGIFAVCGISDRTTATTYVGFRGAYIPDIE